MNIKNYGELYFFINNGKKKRKVEYPPMKVIDMCFWQLGKNLDNKKETR